MQPLCIPVPALGSPQCHPWGAQYSPCAPQSHSWETRASLGSPVLSLVLLGQSEPHWVSGWVPQHEGEMFPGPSQHWVTSSSHPVTLGIFLGMLSWLSLALARNRQPRGAGEGGWG